MKTTTAFSLLAAASLALGSAAFAGSAKDYQVTGPILEVNDSMIAVQKGKDRWEVARDSYEGHRRIENGRKSHRALHDDSDQHRSEGGEGREERSSKPGCLAEEIVQAKFKSPGVRKRPAILAYG